ncbi:uncharacterized protein EV154DRAFT_528388 [Mucor mucedo]|uniref:uncharacterized protein n=1 Tax=Mucor mucedo TaxID=29922 RepID=UPI00221EAD97|nr:uncharacterized protein EV154DRAFT_528388 [Mucor mucedo]KAI7873300.1 hypothetical protein EV154DRAFT_528388 [Mucor mucedo]
MNNLSFVFVFSKTKFDSILTELLVPAKAVSYVSAALNALVLLYACYVLYKRSKGDPVQSYIFTLLAGFFGLLGGTIFYSEAISHGQGYWIVDKAYHSSVWLSCICLFLPICKGQSHTDVARSNSQNAGKLLVYCAYLWSIISIICAIALTAIKVDYELTPEELYIDGSVDKYLARYLQFARLINFNFFSDWGFVSIFIILYFTLIDLIRKLPAQPTKTIALFGFFATVPVITDTITVLVFSANSVSNFTTAVVLNFIFTDCFSVFALVTTLLCAKRWSYTTSDDSSIKNETIP